MSKNFLRLIIVIIFVISTVVFILKNDWVFASIFGIIFIVFLLRLIQGVYNDKNQ
uniref:HycB n=1 Tax=Staphylococcus hyicus TaxID=1284 RepID=A0A221C8U8_STAHY|nr:HycB [Staphylococcus hyicus]